MGKIEKTLEKTSDERATFENGKIYKNILEMIIILTNIVYLIVLYTVGTINNIPLNITMFIINISTFIGVLKTLKKGTFEGSLKPITYQFTTFYNINFMFIVWGILNIIFNSHYLVADYMFLIGLPITIIADIIQLIYINKKIKKLS